MKELILSFINQFRLLKRLRNLEHINKLMRNQIRGLESEINMHKEFVIVRMAQLREFTRVDADVGIRGNNTIILTGVFRKQAYVKFFDMGDGEFERLVLQLKDMRKHSLIRHIDAPPLFHGTFNL